MKLDYFETIKKAWSITWKHKYLWLLGFIIAFSAGGSNLSNSSNYSNSAGDGSTFGTQVGSFAEAYFAIIIFMVLILGVLGLVIWVLSIISTGGLVGAAAKIERGEETSLSDALRIGARNFWRVLGLNIIIGLIILGLVTIILVPLIIIIAVMASGGDSGSAVTAGLVCLVPTLILGIFVIAVFSVVLSVITIYGTRYIVLENKGVFASFGAGRRLIRRRFAETALMFLLVMVISALAGAVFAIPGLIVGVPAFLTLISGIAAENIVVVVLAAVGFMLLAIAMSFLNGVMEVFRSAVWTLTFMNIRGGEEGSEVFTPLPEAPSAPVIPPLPKLPAKPEKAAPGLKTAGTGKKPAKARKPSAKPKKKE